MICPKCQKEINDTAKFCTKCGCNLAQAMAKQTAKPAPAAKPAPPAPQTVCAKCGASLMPGGKFCTKCGASISSVRQTQVSAAPLQESAPQPAPSTVQSSPKTAPQAETASSADKEEKPKKKSKKGAVTAVVLVFVLLAVSAVATTGYLIYNGTIELPAFSLNDDTEEDEPKKDSETEEEESVEDSETQGSLLADADTLFAEADALLEEGKEKTAIDAEIINGMDDIESAIHQFAQASGAADSAQERITDAYASYVSAVISYQDMLNGQALSGNIYSQILSVMEEAEALADEIDDNGFHVDTSSLDTAKEEFISQYTGRMIAAFDEFTNREMWSRTEAWNLMADADKMFDASDLDNPLRLRYAYALSWWIQKQIETELANNTITQKGAAIKIANSIQDMDYNPMMLYNYIHFMNASGEDCAEAELAYNKIIEHIYDTQGIRIGEDFDLQHFWYFNDFGEYSVDDTNGVTPENRQWIRSYMENVYFIKE